MTFLEAARRVLEEAGRPLTRSEIWQAMTARALVETSGKTPERTLYTELGRACLGTQISSARNEPTLYRDDKGRFGLLEWLSKEERAAHAGDKGQSFLGRLWALLETGASEQGIEPRFRAQWRGRPDLSVEAVIVDGRPLARITDELRTLASSIDEANLLERLKDPSLIDRWRDCIAKIQDPRQKTIGLGLVMRYVFARIFGPHRTTFNISVRLQEADRDDLLRLLPEAERERASAAGLPEVCSFAQLGEALGLLRSRRRGRDEDSGDDDGGGADEDGEQSVWEAHHNVIFFGPPGTGKSYAVARIVREILGAEVHRVTFHPEYSYFDFVGTYRPRVGWLDTGSQFIDADNHESQKEPRVYYGFEPGPFSRALVAAARQPDKNVVLVIEEINRGNCAAIFGDVFQLLDRAESADRDHGVSEYAIVPSAEWAAWLRAEIRETCEAWDGRTLRLPRNLYLYATMNTSDQSLFPMDTAFRRRWGMSYRGISAPVGLKTRVPLYAGDEEGIAWPDFAGPINAAVVAHKGNDDKQMGPWFVRPQPGTHLVTSLEFSSKVLFYLWSEVFRDAPNRVFADGISTYDELVGEFKAGRQVFRAELFGIEPGLESELRPDPEPSVATDGEPG